MNKFIIWFVILILFTGFGWYIYSSFTRPVPGEETPDLGREHITDITGIEYNSNPPTSGTHFPVWAKKGVYDRVLSDGYLIHSLEHGYVVVSYNCESKEVSQVSKVLKVSQVSAHEGEEVATDSAGSPQADSAEASASAVPLHVMRASAPFTPQNPPAVEVELPESFQSEECKQLVSSVSELTKIRDRVIVVPRLNLDTKIALTAWTHLLKMDTFERDKAEQFIRDYENRGPEKTME